MFSLKLVTGLHCPWLLWLCFECIFDALCGTHQISFDLYLICFVQVPSMSSEGQCNTEVGCVVDAGW